MAIVLYNITFAAEINQNIKMTKAKITQDALYEYMLAHNMIFTRLGELIGRDVHVVTSRFIHRKDRHGNRLNLNSEHIELINKRCQCWQISYIVAC